ncbi:MAG: hypothetical protein CENE_02851 [Candidatus Celerinatantimonas neptuna]|nr:MAG: hypothetical protein CENE_02851 [Candidatus Celerinatantimonas neptuna]
MGLFNSIKTLFGNSDASPQKTHQDIEYKGFTITPSPIAEKGQYRVAGYIRKTIDGELQEHHFIRSDVCPSEQQALELTISKSQLFIDQMGERLFHS